MTKSEPLILVFGEVLPASAPVDPDSSDSDNGEVTTRKTGVATETTDDD